MHTNGQVGEKEAMMRRQSIHSTLSTRLLRVAVVLGAAVLLAALAAAPASAHEEKTVGRYAFVVGFGDEPAYAGQPNSLQVLITRDGKPATDLAGQLDGLMAHAYYGRKADPKAENAMMALEPHFGDDWGTPGDYRSFFVPTQAGAYTFTLKGRLGDQKINLVVPSGPETFGDVNDPAKAAFPAVKDPSTAQLAQRLDRETTRLNGAVAAATAAQRAAEDTADQARLLALGGLLVGVVGLVVGALAWGRRTAAPAGRPDLTLTGAGKV
jgi:hypothetical protein